MVSTMNYRSAPPPGSFRYGEQDSSDTAPVVRDNRPNPADDAKKADGRHDIGTEDGIHEIGIADFLNSELPEYSACQPSDSVGADIHDERPDVEDGAPLRERTGTMSEEF
jgi:hypothetical protein